MDLYERPVLQALLQAVRAQLRSCEALLQGVWALLRGAVRVWCGRCYGRDMGAVAGDGISAPSHYSVHHFTGGRDN